MLRHGEPHGVPLRFKFLPEYLKDLDYSTHAVGKWHMGYHRKAYFPTSRGFDSFLGFLAGWQGYWKHRCDGYDFRRDSDLAWDKSEEYSTDVFTNESVAIIGRHDAANRPLFLYLAYQECQFFTRSNLKIYLCKFARSGRRLTFPCKCPRKRRDSSQT